MPNVKFNLDKPSLNETYILLKFSYNGKRLRYSTGQKIAPKYWNEQKQRSKQSSNFPQFSELNAYLDKL